MYVEGQYVAGDAADRLTPVMIGGVDSDGNMQVVSVGTNGYLNSSAPGGTTSNASTAALAASKVVLNAAGSLYELTVHNDKASAQYIQLHDAAALPAETSVPVAIYYLASKESRQLVWPQGRTFANGIVACNSSTAATKTIGSADCWFDGQYVAA